MKADIKVNIVLITNSLFFVVFHLNVLCFCVSLGFPL